MLVFMMSCICALWLCTTQTTTSVSSWGKLLWTVLSIKKTLLCQSGECTAFKLNEKRWFDWLRLMPAHDTAADYVFLIKLGFQLWRRCQLCHGYLFLDVQKHNFLCTLSCWLHCVPHAINSWKSKIIGVFPPYNCMHFLETGNAEIGTQFVCAGAHSPITEYFIWYNYLHINNH